MEQRSSQTHTSLRLPAWRSPGDATNVVNDFDAGYALAVDLNARTPVNIAAEATARNMAQQLCRQFAMQIKINAGVSNGAKIATGVRTADADLKPQPARMPDDPTGCSLVALRRDRSPTSNPRSIASHPSRQELFRKRNERPTIPVDRSVEARYNFNSRRPSRRALSRCSS
jgi:hypothetical protein